MAESRLIRWLRNILSSSEKPSQSKRPAPKAVKRKEMTTTTPPGLLISQPVKPSGSNPASPPLASSGSQSRSSRIEWHDTPPTVPRTVSGPPRPQSAPTVQDVPPVVKTPPQHMPATGPSSKKHIDWGGNSPVGGSSVNLGALVGAEDAFEHTSLAAGEQVAYCTVDQVAYHLHTWDFLKTQNRGACCICGRVGTIQIVTLPGVKISQPAIVQPVQPKVHAYPGEVIRLEDIPDHIGRAVTVEAFVHKVYQTKNTGTIFVRFEPQSGSEPVYSGFKLVIFPDYQSAWRKQGLNIFNYQGKYIRVRGVVQHHAKWGIEILVNSPHVIQVISSLKDEN